MWNTQLDEAQAGIKIAGRNINNLRYADDITLMAESREELKNLLMKVKEESEKAGLKLNIQCCSLKTSHPRLLPEGSGGEGGGIGMGNTCKSMADSCKYMAKSTTIL